MLFYDVFETSIGWIGALVSNKGLVRLSLNRSPERVLENLLCGIREATLAPDKTGEVREHLEAYLAGDMAALDLIPLDLEDASPFYQKAWEACRRIPTGETRSYAWLAKNAGSQRAYRAAGQAMANNPLALVIPCHRVIGSKGDLHGYGAGLDIKAKLLALEKKSVP